MRIHVCEPEDYTGDYDQRGDLAGVVRIRLGPGDVYRKNDDGAVDETAEPLPQRVATDTAHTVTLTGEVAIQTAVARKSTQPIDSIAIRKFGDFNFTLMPAKNNDDAKSTTRST